MKIINDDKGYLMSILVLLLLIPVLLLLIITIEEYDHEVNNTVERLESDQIKSIAEDYEWEIIRTTKESLHKITYEAVISGHVTTGNEIIKYIQTKVDENKHNTNPNYNLKCAILDIRPSDNPFKIELTYSYVITTRDNKIKYEQSRDRQVEITDKDYPVYDPLPTLKTGAALNEYCVEYKNKLSEYINYDSDDVYVNIKEPIIIRECPINDYSQHGNNNQSMMYCLNNHYYHNSHDGMCLLCRLENRTSCNHYGFETFILPARMANQAPTSIDHVLLNDRKNQYPGNPITINYNTTLYLDNGHKKKYGL